VSKDINASEQGIFSQLKSGARILSRHAIRMSNRAFDKHICIGVTGFSGSGKSTFITSLIHQLLYSNEAGLSGFLPARDHKIVDVRLRPLPDLELFDYERGIGALASEPPKWPDSTLELSGCVIEVTYKRDSPLKSVMGTNAKFSIEIRDYPGEWLLDIPMLKQDYLSWCIDNAEFLNLPVRKGMFDALHVRLASISPLDVLSKTQLSELCDEYTVFLKRLKKEGLTLIQPGHMLLPGADDSFQPFIPLLNLHNHSKSDLASADENSIYMVMKNRFEGYLSGTVKPFYQDFFKSVDRQVVLIDTLKALGGGKSNFEDMMVAFSRIIDSYKVGNNGLIGKLISPKVDRILFLSSKPDGILLDQHENLRHLTGSIIKRVCKQSIRNTINIETEIVCAVRCTIDNDSYLTATLMNGRKGDLKHPRIPNQLPDDCDWEKFSEWKPLEFQPPSIHGLKTGSQLPCMRMDKVLKELLGDKF